MGMISEIKNTNIVENKLHVLDKEELKKLQTTLLDILTFINEICQTNDIEWGLAGGSALGAVRHHGFIPWDDDVDIHMTRANYEKFKIAFSNQQSPRFKLLSSGDKDYYTHTPKVVDITKKYRTMFNAMKHDYVWVDIFVLEDMYDNKILDFFHMVHCSIYLFVDSCMVTHLSLDNYMKYGTPKLKKMAKMRDFFSHLFGFHSVQQWCARADHVFSCIHNPQSKLVCNTTGVLRPFHEIYKREEITRFTLMPFEGYLIPVFTGYQNILRQRYGDDYMELPPEHEREIHPCIEINLEDEAV